MIIDSWENKKKILEDVLSSCVFEGFSDETLRGSVRKILGKESLSDLVFENGCMDVVDFYIEVKNKEVSLKIKEIDGFENFRIRDKIKTALYLRFESEIENRDQLQQIFSFYLSPSNLCQSGRGVKPATKIFKDCFKIADFIWYEIGDSSSDFNFYTKRVTLAKIIFRCLKDFMIDDNNLSQTKTLIECEIEKVMTFEKYKAQFKSFVKNNFINEKGLLKTPKEILSDLPFFRLRKNR